MQFKSANKTLEDKSANADLNQNNQKVTIDQ